MKEFKKIFLLPVFLCVLIFSSAAQKTSSAKGKILVAYFSFPIDNGKESLDATSGASVTIDGNRHWGNAEYIANRAAKNLNADIFKIDTGDHYPVDYEKIFDFTRNEQRRKIVPELVSHLKNMADYDQVVICYPIWWYALPLAVTSFLNEYDFSGKTIFLAETHGGSGLGGTEKEIASLVPGATVSRNYLVISRREGTKASQKIDRWCSEILSGTK